jgi:hypothetical protein
LPRCSRSGSQGDTRRSLSAQRSSGGKPSAAEVMAQIIAKTDGIPLFVEELTKAARQCDELVRPQRVIRIELKRHHSSSESPDGVLALNDDA